jgi:hypothetical protein
MIVVLIIQDEARKNRQQHIVERIYIVTVVYNEAVKK